MSLRLNLYGFKFQKTIDALGSKDAALLDAALKHLVESLKDDKDVPKAKSWLNKLVSEGYPLRRNRDAPTVPENGDLIVSRMEGEIHVFALFSLIRAIEGQQLLDLASDSSGWKYSAISALTNDMRSSGFNLSKNFPEQLCELIPAISDGTPLFGDGFRTSWSFYTILENESIGALIDGFNVALKYERDVGEEMKEFVARKNIPTRISDNGREFIVELSGWLTQIQNAGLDAIIVYW